MGTELSGEKEGGLGMKGWVVQAGMKMGLGRGLATLED